MNLVLQTISIAAGLVFFTLKGSANVFNRFVLTHRTILVLLLVLGASSFQVLSQATVSAKPSFKPAPGTYTSAQSVVLSDATPGASVYYTLDGSKPTANSAIYVSPLAISLTTSVTAAALVKGGSFSNLAKATYTITPSTATPTFSLAGGTYLTSQTVSITDFTPGAVIYYTVDGSMPTTASLVFSKPIALTSTKTLTAIAQASGASISKGIKAVYDITPTAATPVIGVPSGTYTSSQMVTVTDATNGATIYFTTNGKIPNLSAGKYKGSITINSNQTLTVSARAPGGSFSPSATASYTIAPAAATPTISLQPGTYYSSQSLTLLCKTPGANIYYTTDNSPPTMASHLYSAPLAIVSTQTITATAIAPGGSFSPTIKASYTIIPAAATPVFSIASGTYTSTQALVITDSTNQAVIYFTSNGTIPTRSAPKYGGPIPIRASQTITAMAIAPGGSFSAPAKETFNIIPPAATPVMSPASGKYTSSQTVSIRSATPSAVIYYTTDSSNPTVNSNRYNGPINVNATQTLIAAAIAPGGSLSPSVAATYTIEMVTPNPAISPASGTYVTNQTVTMSDVTSGAVIYYTTDGSAPATSSAQYTGPITVSSTKTVSAIAVAPSCSLSSVSTAKIVVTPAAIRPVFNIASGLFTTVQNVVITDGTSDAVIYFTTDGTSPNQSSPVYRGPISVNTTQTITATAKAAGGSFSALAVQTFTITLPAASPVLSPTPGTFYKIQDVSIRSVTPGAVIYYTLDGSTPTTNSLMYTGPISVRSTQTLTALAVAEGASPSQPVAATYTIAPPAAPPTIVPASGTYVNNQTVTIATITSGASIFYTTDGSAPTSSSTQYTEPITVGSTQTISAVAATPLAPLSTVTTAKFVMTPAAATPVFTISSSTYSPNQTAVISDATNNAVIYFTTDGSTPNQSSPKCFGPIVVNKSETITAMALAPGGSFSAPAVQTFTILPLAAAPKFSPASGTFTSAQTITLISTTPGAVIYYTIDASTPTINSMQYAGPISVSSSQTITAMSSAPGWFFSQPVAAVYSITPPAALPTFTPATGTYDYTQTVAISDSTVGAAIYYTVDGSAPNTSSALYSVPITVSSTQTVKAAAIAVGGSISQVSAVTYTITPPVATPTFNPPAGTYTNSQSVTISDLIVGAVIYYTTDGSTPTTASAVYQSPIVVNSTEMLTAAALAPNFSMSLSGNSLYTMANTQAQYQTVNFSYTLPNSTSSVPPATSAGVFNTQGKLIKTLWSAQLQDQNGNTYQNGGTYQGVYEGLFSSQYYIKVLTSNVSYTWDGVIGNTSGGSIAAASQNCSAGAPTVSPFCSFATPVDPTHNPFVYAYQWGSFGFGKVNNLSLTFAGNQGWAATGYAEGAYNVATFNDSTPNFPTVPVITNTYPSSSAGLGAIDGMHEQNIAFGSAATDNTTVYMVNTAAWFGNPYVTAFNANTFQPISTAQWPQATTGKGAPAYWFTAEQDFANPNQYPTGGTLAIIDGGPRCDGQRNYVDSGSPMITVEQAPASNLFYSIPGSIAVQFQGDVLAVGHVAGNCSYKYSVAGTAITGTIAVPAGVAAISNTSSIASQPVIKLFSKSTGALTASIPATNPTQMAFTSVGLWVLNQSLNTATILDSAKNRSTEYVSTQSTSTPNHLQFISFNGSTPVMSQADPIPGLSNPVAVAVRKTDDHVFVLDGGINQVMYEFASNNLSTPVATYGVMGGYLDGNTRITSDRMILDGYATTRDFSTTQSSIAVEDNGDVWITDGGNIRILHIAPPSSGECTLPSGSTETSYCYVDQIAQLHPNYQMNLDETDPTRMFVGMMEYKVDGTQPLTPGDPTGQVQPAWQLLNNWSVMAPTTAQGHSLLPFLNVNQVFDKTDSSGTATYASILTADWVANPGVLFQLPAATTDANGNVFQPALQLVSTSLGNVSFITHPSGRQFTISPNPNSATTFASITSYTYVNGNQFQVINQPFDGNALNPHWGNATTIAGINVTTDFSKSPKSGYPWGGWGQGADVTPSANGVFPIFQAAENKTKNGTPYYSPGFPHFAGVNPAVSTTDYAFEVMPELCLNTYTKGQTGFFPYPANLGCSNPNDAFGSHDGIGVSTSGSSFFVGYDGQYANYGDQFFHYYDDGLMVGQFGNSPYSDLSQGGGGAFYGIVTRALTPTPVAGSAGNIGQFQTTQADANGNIDLYHTDESQYAGIHRWTVANVGSISEAIATVNYNSPVLSDLVR